MQKLRLTTFFALLFLVAGAMTGLAQVNYSESFDGTTFPPLGWTATPLVGTMNWARVTTGTYPTSTPHSGAAMAQFDGYSTNVYDQAMLVTPVVDYSSRGTTATTISFWMNRCNNYPTTTVGPLDVYVNTAPNTTGALLLGSVQPYYLNPPAVLTPGWYQYSFAVPTTYNTGTNYFIFKATSEWWNNQQIDDIAWVGYPSGPVPPSGLTLTMGGPTQINASWTKNAANNDVLIVYNTTATFGTPVNGTSYIAGQSITGGGTVLYAGSATSANLPGVLSNTNYNFRAYSKGVAGDYSSAYTSQSITTPAASPYFEGFEGITAANQFPPGWTYTADARTFTGPYGGFNAAAHTGTKFAAFYYYPSGTQMYMMTCGIYLTGGVQYNAFAWYVTDGYSGWNSLKLMYGSTQSVGSMLQVTGASVTNPTNSTYQRLAGTFTPPTSGMYYLGIVCDHNTIPYYLSIDDIAVNDLPQKDIAVTNAILRNADSTWARGVTRKHVVQAVIQNLGWENNPTSVPMTYSDGVNTVNETVTPVWSGNTGTVTFTTKYIPQNTGANTITVTAVYPGDVLATNNSFSSNATIQNVKVVGYEDFNRFVVPGFGYGPNLTGEPFTANNVNGGNTFLTSAGTGIGGSQAVEYPGDVMVANDWLILPAAYLNAGSSYRFRLQYASQLGLPQNFQFFSSQTPDIASMQPMTNGTFSNVTNTAFTESSDLANGIYPYFNTTTATNYYVGIKVTSPANNGKLIFDNMLLDVNPAPPPKIGFRPDSPASAPYIDDPSTARVDLTAIYHSPGLINRRFQVTNVTNLYGSNGYFLWDVTTATPWITLTKDAALPTPGPNPFTPPRPRENQFFSMSVDPTTFAPGTYNGMITFRAKLFNDDYPSTGNGLISTNDPLNVPVVLTVTMNGAGGAGTVNQATRYAVTPGIWEMRDVNNKLLATINNHGPNTIESVTITEYPNTLPPTFSRLRYVRKYWQINATGDMTNWTMDVDFYYTDTEANAGGVLLRGNLRGWRQPIPGGSAWKYAGGGATVNSSASYPATTMVRILNLDNSIIAGNFVLATQWNQMPKSDASPVTEFGIEQNYPNPFNPSTSIRFAIPEDGFVNMTIFNNLGVEVANPINESLEAGTYNYSFDASSLPAGTYIYKVTYGGTTLMKTMTLVK